MLKYIIWVLAMSFMLSGFYSCTEERDNAVNKENETAMEDTMDNDMMAENEVDQEDVRDEVMEQEGVYFIRESWQEALDRAKQEGKPIFLDAYADWCRPCKEMDREVFSQSRAGDFFNSNFVSVKLNIDEGDGLMISEEYNIDEIPTYLFFNSEGELINQVTGKMPAETLINKASESADIKS